MDAIEQLSNNKVQAHEQTSVQHDVQNQVQNQVQK
jgi:hypothetical protein